MEFELSPPWASPWALSDTPFDNTHQRFFAYVAGFGRTNIAWRERKADLKGISSDINWVIMDYLVSEGYPGAAEKFAQETNLCRPTDIEGIRERVRIRNAIHSGKIEEAIGMINEIDPEVS